MSTTRKLIVITPSDREIALTRTFNAPPSMVWDAMTRPELLKRWLLGPDGWSLVVCEIDLRPGGAYRYVWRRDSGKEMGMGGVYLEMVHPERIVSTEKFDDPWYSGEAIGTSVLNETPAVGQTTLTTTLRYDSRATRDMVLKSPMDEGVETSYKRLETVLASMAN